MTTVSDALRGVTRLGIDTAPLIYLVERHPVHGPVVREIVIPIDERVAEEAARLRAIHRLRTPDAIQLAVARAAGCGAFLTNDNDLSRATGEIPIVQLADLI